jgi:hypothetical protein
VSYLIVFRTSPDVDHMAPLAWKLLEEGETVHAVMSTPYDVAGDHRLELLRGYPRFELHELRPAGSQASQSRQLAGRARATLPYALWMLRRHRVRLVAVEWGYGLPPAYDRLRSPAGVAAVLRSLGSSLVRGEQPQQPRASFIVAARLLGIPTVCLPHGINIKLDPIANDEIAELVSRGDLDFSSRNRFAAYVLDSEHHRRMHLEYARGDPQVMQTWGSLRWAPDWFEVNRRLAPQFDWPGEPGDGLRVVFMVPKWKNRVDAPAAIELVRRIQALDGVSLAVMGHPRSHGEDGDPLRADSGVDWTRIHDISGANSVSVIREADVVVDVGSSIGMEVVLQGKVLVNPAYVHEIETLFDSLPGAAVTASSADEVVDYLRAHAAGQRHEMDPATRDELLREAVYGSRDPFDVPALYYERVSELAAGRCEANGSASATHPTSTCSS